jgi:non-ribosomal peptide synthetase component F
VADLVAVAVPRSAQLVVAITAVLASRGGHLPIAVTHPKERAVLADAKPVRVVTTVDVEESLDCGSVRTVVLDTAESVTAPTTLRPLSVDDADRRTSLPTDAAACPIYTLGSTGGPSCILVARRNVANLLANTLSAFGFGESSMWTVLHSPAFVFSVWHHSGKRHCPLLLGLRPVGLSADIRPAQHGDGRHRS